MSSLLLGDARPICSLRHKLKGLSRAFADDFLHVEFGALPRDAEQGALMVAGEFGMTELRRLPRLPMLLRTGLAAWQAEARDCEERFRIETVVACTGTARTQSAGESAKAC